MYTAGYSSPPLTNNPFIPDGGAHPSARFPDLSTPPTSNMNTGMGMQQQFGYLGGGGGGPQQQQGLYQQYPQQQQQPPPMTLGYAPQQQQQQMGNNNGYISPNPQGYGGQAQGQIQMQGAQYQPSTPFGQQQLSSANVSGSSYSYLQPQHQQQQQQNAYNPAQQQLQNNPGYIAQFDPYSSLSQVFNDGQHQQQQQGGYGTSSGSGMVHNLSTGSSTTPSILSSSSSTSTSNSNTSSSYGTSPTGDPHPRDYIRTHKAEIERWDAYAWKQFLGAFESLMKAWEARKGEVESKLAMLGAQMQMGVNGMGMQMQMQYDGGYYVAQMQQEGLRLQGLKKEAENNYDSVAASMFQMREVFGGYRQSGDLASKSRVREATNAALQGLPGWPQPY